MAAKRKATKRAAKKVAKKTPKPKPAATGSKGPSDPVLRAMIALANAGALEPEIQGRFVRGEMSYEEALSYLQERDSAT